MTEVSSSLFAGSQGEVNANADMDDTFSSSVEVKISDTQEDVARLGFAAGAEVYPFGISLYISGTSQKTKPAPGYSVTISLPVPEHLLDVKELISVVHKSESGVVTTIPSRLEQKNGIWLITFEATEFSPYALVVRSAGTAATAGNYDEPAGVPYYINTEGAEYSSALPQREDTSLPRA